MPMEIHINCFIELDSVSVRDRAYEAVYTYQARYHPFAHSIADTRDSATTSLTCPFCHETLTIATSSIRALRLKQMSFLAAFLAAQIVSLALFSWARRADTGTSWMFAVLFLIFGCILSGALSFNIRQFEFENHYKIIHNATIKIPDHRVSFKKHRLDEQGYAYAFRRMYAAMRIVYFASIAAYLSAFYSIVVRGNSEFILIVGFLAILCAVALGILAVVNHFYDRKWSRTIRLK